MSAQIYGTSFEERAKKFKWKKRTFADRLEMKDKGDSSLDRFARFNTRSEVVKYASSREYLDARLDKLASSSSWSKEETDVLMSLCEQFNLRFNVIADRFSMMLKDRYDRKLEAEIKQNRKKGADDVGLDKEKPEDVEA